MSSHPVMWQSPQPLWARFGPTVSAAASAPDQARPAILRFATDEFMEQWLAMLASDPRQLGEVIARPETWRNPSGEAPDLVERVPTPRLARTLARLRNGRNAVTTLPATTHEEAAIENGVARALPLKLYAPAHQRYYLVAANLVCGLPGFPDRALATGGCEQIGYVLRRLLPRSDATSDLEEYAFVKDQAGARWQRVAPDADARDPGARLADGEERLPLFPTTYRDDVNHPRRLLAGLIPVGRREEYMSTRAHRSPPTAVAVANGAAGAGGAPAGATPVSERKEQFKVEVSEPWKNLVRSAHAAAASIMDDDRDDDPFWKKLNKRQATAERTNEQLQLQSWLILLDFADFLALHLRPVWEWVIDDSAKRPLSGAERRLFDWLDAAVPAPGSAWQITTFPFATSLADALKRVRTPQARAGLEGATHQFPHAPGGTLAWPGFLHLLAGVRQDGTSFVADGAFMSLNGMSGVPAPSDDDVQATVPPTPTVETRAAYLDKLVQLVITAIDLTAPAQPAPPVPFAARLRDALRSTQGDPGWFVLRCAFVGCDCGPVKSAVLSAPSQRFQLASFFDPDAPARAIRIALPIDTTPAGLRKFNKNTAFVISDLLCGQMQRAKALGFGDLVRSVLPWPFHKDLDVGTDGMGPCNLGMICSLSIPIITICALILLMMIVLLLDLIFKWIPWFIVCFPLPFLKGKRATA
jgi:hypothetical protein